MRTLQYGFVNPSLPILFDVEGIIKAYSKEFEDHYRTLLDYSTELSNNNVINKENFTSLLQYIKSNLDKIYSKIDENHGKLSVARDKLISLLWDTQKKINECTIKIASLNDEEASLQNELKERQGYISKIIIAGGNSQSAFVIATALMNQLTSVRKNKDVTHKDLEKAKSEKENEEKNRMDIDHLINQTLSLAQRCTLMSASVNNVIFSLDNLNSTGKFLKDKINALYEDWKGLVKLTNIVL